MPAELHTVPFARFNQSPVIQSRMQATAVASQLAAVVILGFRNFVQSVLRNDLKAFGPVTFQLSGFCLKRAHG